MYINTKSKETMCISLLDILNISKEELDELLDNCYDSLQMNHRFLDMDDQYKYFASYVKEHLSKEINEILFVHLSRRFNGTNVYNLINMSSKETSLSNYLEKYGLTFKYDKYIKMYINEKEIDVLSDDVFDNKYLKDRFGYRCPEHSISGYGFMDCIEENEYYNIAIEGPKFFDYLHLYNVDDNTIINTFIENSILYKFEYVVPIKNIEFEFYEELEDSEKVYHIIIVTLQRLYFDKYDPMFNKEENIIIKIKDTNDLSEKYLINKIKL